MSDRNETAKLVLRAQIEENLARLCMLTGDDPVRLKVALDDILSLNDRIEPWDVATMFAEGINLPVPDVGWIEGGDSGLFYRGFINMVWGDDGHGKSLLIDQVTWVERKRGNKVMILESEELSPVTRVSRWLDESNDRQLITNEDVAGVIVYPIHRKLSDQNVQMLATRIANEQVSVVFIDSLGTLMANSGLDETNAASCYAIKEQLLDKLAAAGAAVVVIDHVTKADGEKSKSIGSTRKRSMLSGAGFELRAEEGSRWSRKKAGHADLRCWKDRQGAFNPSEHVATLWVTPSAVNGYLTLAVEAPEDVVADDQPPAQAVQLTPAQKVLAYAADGSPVTSQIVANVIKACLKKDADELLKRLSVEGLLVYSKVTKTYGIPIHTATIQ